MGRKRKNSDRHASLPPRFPPANTQAMAITRGDRINNVVEEGPCMGDVDVEAWPIAQQVFVFKVLCIIHRLQPRWDFQYAEGPNIGVRLTLYGYTVVLQPTNTTIDEVGVRACRHALCQMHEVNPEWLVPPMPEEGPAGPEWDWVMLLEDYCVLNGRHQPVYSPFAVGEQAWHCDVQVNDRLFHTAVPSAYVAQARNTVAHAALCKLVVTCGVVAVNRDAGVVSPAPQFQSPSARQQLGEPVVKTEDDATHPEMPSAQAEPAGPSMNRDRMRAMQQHDARARRRGRRPRSRGPAGPAKKTGANKFPLANDRLSRLRGETAEEEPAKGQRGGRGPAGDEPEEGKIPEGRAAEAQTVVVKREAGEGVNSEARKNKLAMLVLKKLQISLRSMRSDVPYTYMLMTFCNILQMNEPEIRVERHPTDPRPGALVIRAYFDESNAHFHSISPVNLCYTSVGNEEEGRDRAVQQVILTLVENARTNAGLAFHSEAYRDHVKWIRDLETILLESLYGKNLAPENTN